MINTKKLLDFIPTYTEMNLTNLNRQRDTRFGMKDGYSKKIQMGTMNTAMIDGMMQFLYTTHTAI